jgi:hypothetical protein
MAKSTTSAKSKKTVKAKKPVTKIARVSKKTSAKSSKSTKTAKLAKTKKSAKSAKSTKTVKPSASKSSKTAKKAPRISRKTVKLPKKRTSVLDQKLAPVVHKKNNDAPKRKAPVAKFLTEQQVLEKLKSVFPALSRKRVIENVSLDAKQIKKLATKFPNFLKKIPVETKIGLGIEDEAVKSKRAADLAAKTRVVDTEKAKDASDILAAIEQAKAARGEVQTSKVIKAMQLRINRRLVGIYGNIKKIYTQFNVFSAIALKDTADSWDRSNPQLANTIRDQITNVGQAFSLNEATDYDYFESAGSQLEIDLAAPLDEEGVYVDDDSDANAFRAAHVKAPESPEATASLRAYAAQTEQDDGESSGYDDNDSMFQDDSSSDSASDDKSSGDPKKKVTRKKQNKINILGMTRLRYADRAYMSHRIEPVRDLFGGAKRNAVVGFTAGALDKYGTFNTSTVVIDANGVARNNEETNEVLAGNSSLDLFNDRGLFDDFVVNLSRHSGLKITRNLGLNHIMSRKAMQFLKLHGFGTHGSYLYRKNADNTGVYGVAIFVAPAPQGTSGCRILTVPFGIIGLSHKELTTVCLGDFENTTDKLFEYIAYSILTSGLMSQGKVFGFSQKERSLLEPPKPEGAPKQDKLIKLANGHIHYLPDVDRRNEFASFRESLKLPDYLDRELIDEKGVTEFDKFAGSIAYVDMKSNIAFYYTKDGKLTSTIFSGACELNDRDRADMMKSTPHMLGVKDEEYDPTSVEDRKDMSPYGCVTKLPAQYFNSENLHVLNSQRVAGFPGFQGYQPRFVVVEPEHLRESYNSDRIYYDAVHDAVDNYVSAVPTKNDRDSNDTAGNAHLLLSKSDGLTDLDYNTAVSYAARGGKARLTGRDITSLKIMLHIAAKSEKEWPRLEVLHARAEDARVKPPRAEDLAEIIGNFDGLTTNDNNQHPTAMPHQAYTLYTMKHQETAALDCDMGGGKTFMSALDGTRWIKEGVHGKPSRVCVVMPASLIENYMVDLHNNFFGKNVNFFVLSSATRTWAKMDNNKIASLARSAPINTVFIASYEWLGLDSYPVITGTQLAEKTSARKNSKGKKMKIIIEVPHTEQIYPNAQLLLDIGINVLYLDESQKIKNPASGFHKAVQVLSGIPVKRIMTGTMVTRDVDDVFTQTSFIDGTMMGTRRRFQTLYCEDARRTEIKKGNERRVRLHMLASGVMQLRRSMWMGLLPKKEEHFEFVDLEGLHGAVYRVLMNDLQDDAGTDEEAITYLNQLLTGTNSDLEDDSVTKDLEKLRADACGDVTEDDDSSLSEAGRSSGSKLSQFAEKKRNMGEKVAMLQAFISSPQSLVPEKFSKKAQSRLKDLNLQLPEFTAKDTRIEELITKHWSGLDGNRYMAMSEQNKKFAVPSQMRGKVIIFALNIATVEHIYAFLKKSKYSDCVVRYLKSDAKAADNLRDFKDPENASASIIVAAETSVIYGQNMQAADMMIKITIPWTTGDYDQAVARIYRNGQKLKCEIYNIMANGTFEIAKLAKFLIRQNSNRKLISDYTNPYNMNHALGAVSKGSAVEVLQTEDDLRNFAYEDKETGNSISLDLLEVHDSIYAHELHDAEKYIKLFKDAGYGDPNTGRIDVASGVEIIDALDASLRPKDDDGNPVGPGTFKYADMMYFNGDNIINARTVNKKSMSAEIKRARDLELAYELGDDAVNALNSKGANALLISYMQRALEEVLEKHPGFKKFIPEGSTRGFSLFLGQALRDADYRLVGCSGLPGKNFATDAGNDLSNHDTRAELMTLARMCYNKVVSNYPGCVAIDEDLEVKYNKSGDAVDVIGFDKKNDRSLMKKNAMVLQRIIGKADIKPNAPTPTEEVMQRNKLEDARKNIVEREADKIKAKKPAKPQEDDIDPEEDVEGINLGVSELIVVDDVEEGATRNIPTNDSVYVFAPAGTNNDPKMLRKLARVNLGMGRGTTFFTKKVMWVYHRPVSDMSQVVAIANAVEAAGGYVERVGKGSTSKFAFLTDPSFQALFRIKAPTNFSKLDLLQAGLTHTMEATAAASKAKSEVIIGLFCFDRRILVVGESRNEAMLRKIGFKRIEMLRVDFDKDSRIQKQLNTMFSRIRKAGLTVLNSEIVAKRLRVIIGKPVEI